MIDDAGVLAPRPESSASSYNDAEETSGHGGVNTMHEMNPCRSAVKRKLTSALRPRYNVPGSRPGTVKASEDTTVKLSVFDFNAEGFREERDASLDTCRKYFTSNNVTWVHV